MASQHLAFITLDSIILDYMGESEQSIHKYKKLYDIAYRLMDMLGIDFFYQIQSFKLPINGNLTVTLPSNCLNVIKAGVLNSGGEIVTLYANNKLTTYADLNTNRIAKTQDNTIFNWDIQCNGGWYYNYWANGTYTNLYGLPSGQPVMGSFKVDSYNGVILLNEDYQFDYLMVECLVNPQENEECRVPIQFREAIVAGLWWKDKKAFNVKRGAVGINRDLKDEFGNAKRIAIKQYSPFLIEQAYQAAQEQTRYAIKG